MEAARAAQGGRRKNLSLRPASRARRQKESFDAAFESFYREHVAEVYQYALAVLGNSPDAEDVTQQTFLNAYRAFQRGERPRKPHNWLIKIAHNVCRMRWRQSGRRPQEVPLERAVEPVAREDEGPSLDEVLTALARLPFNQRAAIVMREIEDRSYAEIAEVLETTVPAVEALIFRARSNLRERRSALAGALAVAPVPGSLASFFGGGSGGLAAAGGALVGSELAVKAAAVVATGIVAGGLGFKAADVVATPDQRQAARSPRLHEQPRPLRGTPLRQSTSAAVKAAALRHLHSAVSRKGAPRGTPTNDRPSESGSSGTAPSGSAPTASAQSAPGVSTVSPTTNSVTQIVPSVPAAPAPTIPPPPPAVTVSTPVVSVTVTVPTVTVPPPPPIK